MPAIDKNSVTLELPSIKVFPSYVEALKEGFRRGIAEVKSPAEITAIEADPGQWIAILNTPPTGTYTTPSGHVIQKVPCETLWLCAQDIFIGEVSFRHELNDFLRVMGGHVGYGIRPTLMNQGYGTLALRLTRERAARRGMDRLLVTCDPDNQASEKVIIKNGGVYETTSENPYGYSPSKLFWVPTQT
jgi:predicted acetyltransferase